MNYLGSALSILGDLLDRVTTGGIPPERTALLGFSQGACLALEFARRRVQRLSAVIGLSGGLIGDTVAPPPAGVRPLQGMPVLLGCSERDPHIPIGRVRETDAVMRALAPRWSPASTRAAVTASTRARLISRARSSPGWSGRCRVPPRPRLGPNRPSMKG